MSILSIEILFKIFSLWIFVKGQVLVKCHRPLWFGILLDQSTFISCSMASQFNLLVSFQQVMISWMLRSLYEFVDCIWFFGTWSFTQLHFGHGLINWRASLINKINGSRFHLSRFNMWIFILMRRGFGITKTNLNCRKCWG